jgi:hypothetical protein
VVLAAPTHNQQSATLRPESSSGISVHPAAMLFPMMGEQELSDLADDIAANGLIEPIVLYHGEVLDGRNRLAACEMAGVEPHFAEVDGGVPSPTMYVLSKNLHRRHLTTSQRGAIAAEVVPLLKEESLARRNGHLKNQPSFTPTGTNEPFHANEIAAKELNVGERTVARAVQVKRENPKAFERVKRGEITLNEANKEQHKRAKLEPGETKPPTAHQKKLAEKDKERMISGLSTINGHCQGLHGLKLGTVATVCTKDELATWAGKARDLAKELREFAGKLERMML